MAYCLIKTKHLFIRVIIILLYNKLPFQNTRSVLMHQSSETMESDVTSGFLQYNMQFLVMNVAYHA